MPVCFACRVTVIVVLKAEFQMMWRLIDDLISVNSGEKITVAVIFWVTALRESAVLKFNPKPQNKEIFFSLFH